LSTGLSLSFGVMVRTTIVIQFPALADLISRYSRHYIACFPRQKTI
jgi:hypothetical protein